MSTITLQNYEEFFRQGFGQQPFAYQRHIATDAEMPALINAPTGAGKTAAILGAWLWRRLNNPQSVGRRLVYCLPMRTLVEQTAKVAGEAIERLEAQSEEVKKKSIAIHVLMGGEVTVDWDALPECEAIIIGTQDMLLSRALNRGYALSTARYPLPFGLLNNDCLFVFDEIQLMGDALATSAQLAAFRQTLGAFGVQQSVWMSATLDKKWLKTVDFKEQAEKLGELKLTADDRAIPELNQRLHAVKRIQPASSSCRTPDGLAGFVKEQHMRGTQTLVVVNRVARAREVFAALESAYALRSETRKKKNAAQDASVRDAAVSDAASVPQLELIHSRFRPVDRKRWHQIFDDMPDKEGTGRIIVATQVVEAGLDISSRLLVTDIAPYSSLVQRFGRCNRKGEDEEARVFWIDRPLINKEEKLAGKELLDDKERALIVRPYALEQVDKARDLLARLTSVAPADLPDYSDEVNYEYVLRRRDIIDLFDTTTDLSGYDLDISRFVRGGDERDVYVAWRKFEAGEQPNSMTPRPAQRELCPVSIGELKLFLDKLKNKQPMAWRWNPLLGVKPLSPKQRERPGAAGREHGWEKVNAEELRPGMTVLMDSRAGGYTTKRGWDKEVSEDVPEVPLKESERRPAESIGGDGLSGNAANAVSLTKQQAENREAHHPPYAQTLRAHSTEARQKMIEILKSLGDPQLEPFREDLLVAVLHHDWGKAHKVFQDTMRRGLQGALDESLYPSEPLAKTVKKNIKHHRKHFRHELASALALLQQKETDLRVYLAASHHGKVRMSIRALPNEARPNGEQTEKEERKYARGIWDKDELPAVRLSDDVEREAVTLDLKPMLLGSADGEASWLERMTRLRDTIGVFRLAYLECLIRAADMQASAHPINCITIQDSTDPRTENNA